jgi:hypothetical protein
MEEIRSAKVVRLEGNITPQQLMQLRNDQFIQAKNGHQVSVSTYRQLQQVFAISKSPAHREMKIPILAAATGPGVPIKPGETPAQLLSRPDSQPVRLRSGKVVSSAQMRALAPYVEKTYGVQLQTPAVNKAAASGPSVKIKTLADLKALHNSPDSTIVESPKGTRVTLGQLRQHFGKTPPVPFNPAQAGGNQAR